MERTVGERPEGGCERHVAGGADAPVSGSWGVGRAVVVVGAAVVVVGAAVVVVGAAVDRKSVV